MLMTIIEIAMDIASFCIGILLSAGLALLIVFTILETIETVLKWKGKNEQDE